MSPSSDNQPPIDESKRNAILTFFKGGAAALTMKDGFVGGILGGAVANLASDAFYTAKEYLLPNPVGVGDVFLKLFGMCPPEICNGVGNLQGATTTPSKYIQRATSSVTTGICEAYKDFFPINVCEAPGARSLESVKDAVFLGGPLANPKLAEFLGYEVFSKGSRDGADAKPFPQASNRFKLRYEHYHGETELGEFEGKIHFAKRIDDGEVVSRREFAIKDHKTQKILRCEKEGEWLASEFLQIVKLKDEFDHTKVFIWGLHGHSIDGFTDTEGDVFKHNMNKLLGFVEGMDQFQVVIPISLKRQTVYSGKERIHAEAQWDGVLVEDYSSGFYA